MPRSAAPQAAAPGWRTVAARHRWSLALASGALLVAAGRPWGLGWLALVAFVPLLAALRLESSSPRGALLVALAALGPAFVVYEAIGPFLPALLPAVATAATVPFAALGALAPRLRRVLGGRRRGERALVLAFPLLWLAAEGLPGRSWLLGRLAMPLFAVGYSQAGLPTMQLARLGGVAAVGLAVLACNALLTLVLLDRRRWAAAALVGLAVLVAAAARSAPAPLGPAGTPRAGALPVARLTVVQRDLPDAAYAAAAAFPAARTALVEAFAAPTRTLAPAGAAGFALWPEGALPGPLPAAGPSGLEPALAGLGPVLAGAPARTPEGIANAAFAWEHGALRQVYAKRRLAPLFEDALVPGRGDGVAQIGQLRVGPLICFEAAFAELARAAARRGAQALAVLTNDAFARFLDAPREHLRLARFRAVETGLPLAFASNAGPSAVLDGAGRIVAATPAGQPAAVQAAVRIGAGTTPFVRWGDWPGTLALAGSGLLALLAGAKGGGPRP